MRYFRAKKDSFLWHKGCILENSVDSSPAGYRPIDKTTMWDVGDNGKEFVTAGVVENRPEWFEEVFKVNLLTRSVYKLKDEARAMMEKEYA